MMSPFGPNVSFAGRAARNPKDAADEKPGSPRWLPRRQDEGVAKAEYVVVACAMCVCVVALPVFGEELSDACTNAICAVERMGDPSKSCMDLAQTGDRAGSPTRSMDPAAVPTLKYAIRSGKSQLFTTSITSPNIGSSTGAEPENLQATISRDCSRRANSTAPPLGFISTTSRVAETYLQGRWSPESTVRVHGVGS